MKMSIAIPTYEMGGIGHEVIQYALRSLEIQTFQNFEVVISDQSQDDKTQEICQQWSEKLNIVYVKYPFKKGCYTANTNNAVNNCSGDIIKYLDSDDFLYDKYSLENIYNSFEGDIVWVASDYIHSYDRVNFFNVHSPTWNNQIYLYNTIGSPTGVAIKRECAIPMDENYRWMGDADLYYMIYKKWGEPKILRTVTAVHLLWNGQTSNVLSELQEQEVNYAISKYEGIKQ